MRNEQHRAYIKNRRKVYVYINFGPESLCIHKLSFLARRKVYVYIFFWGFVYVNGFSCEGTEHEFGDDHKATAKPTKLGWSTPEVRFGGVGWFWDGEQSSLLVHFVLSRLPPRPGDGLG